MKTILKKFGIAGLIFFFLKGLLWLTLMLLGGEMLLR
ncbi:MAG: hypothetical protein KatS3mg031_3036 [Chitinophagales bacterium]|nr:MAG: hypothetical protein KatS3mg031_1330 [Chitinophagales bacterium]GIV35501.1 MAG: hypothetical protein KatS3mg031_3036 [Chitinophagales bacterium]